jgi:hypothetical protein
MRENMLAPRLSPQAKVANEVLVHLLTRLSSVSCEEKPFPHFFAENIFPAHIYEAMLANLPALEIMRPMGERHRNGDGSFNRYQTPLRQKLYDEMNAEQAALWSGVHQAISAPEFKIAVFAKLKSGLSFRYSVPPQQASKIPGYPRTTLIREFEGYSIAPHPDTRKKVVTMQFALPADHSQADLGTTFYQRTLAPADWLSVPRGFRTAKQMPFIPNCCYGFSVLNTLTLKSWHGREEVKSEQGVRNSLLHIYYNEPGEGETYEQ